MLLELLTEMNYELHDQLEVVFVVDGSPDHSFEKLNVAMKEGLAFSSQLLGHSRNFGSFAAIRTGLIAARGDYFAVMAADLQEPPELATAFFRSLVSNEYDVVIGTRSERSDPLISKLSSLIFWGMYRRLIVKDMPKGGVDTFGCNRLFRDQLVRLDESRSSLIALIFWLGFRRKFISYKRAEREHGTSGWTYQKKVDYMFDSIFAFTDYPIRLLIRMGFMGCLLSVILALIVLLAYLLRGATVPGYTATIIAVLFFGALNTLSLGVVGSYAWRGYENSKQRPQSVVSIKYEYTGSVAIE